MGLRVVLDVSSATCVSCKTTAPLTVVGIFPLAGHVETKAPAGWFRYDWQMYGAADPAAIGNPPAMQLYLCGACAPLFRPPSATIVQRDPT